MNNACANCGTSVRSRYCPDCGQETGERVTSFKKLLEEFGSEFLNFDSKLFITLSVLARRPGLLTTEYIEGRRIRYLAPVRLFVLLSAIMIIVSSMARDTGLDFITRLLFFAAPVLALPLCLLYWSQRRYYIEHLIFVLHIQSYACLLGAMVYPIVGILRFTTGNHTKAMIYQVLWGLLVWLMLYLLLAMRRVYREPLPVTLAKFAGMGVIYALPVAALIIFLRSRQR